VISLLISSKIVKRFCLDQLSSFLIIGHYDHFIVAGAYLFRNSGAKLLPGARLLSEASLPN
jgi:hypothetical protein